MEEKKGNQLLLDLTEVVSTPKNNLVPKRD